MTNSPALLEVHELSLHYGQFLALSNISMRVAAGEVVAVIGANGAGKSSLIKAISGNEPSTSGTITFQGQSLNGRSTSQIIKSGIGYVPEGRKIFPSLSVEENILMGGQIGQPGPWTLQKILALFPELAEKRHLSGTQLSGGQQQMIAIGRALMTNPKLLLCDEISLGLAPVVINRLYALVQDLAAEGMAVLVVEQAVRKALSISRRYYCMLEGHISLAGLSADAVEDNVSRAYFGR